MNFKFENIADQLKEIYSLEDLIIPSVIVYHGGLITFQAGKDVEQAKIISANLKNKIFSFEFRWDRNKILYSMSCCHNAIDVDGHLFGGVSSYRLNEKKIPFRVEDARFNGPLNFKGIWIEDAVVWEFAINFTSCSTIRG